MLKRIKNILLQSISKIFMAKPQPKKKEKFTSNLIWFNFYTAFHMAASGQRIPSKLTFEFWNEMIVPTRDYRIGDILSIFSNNVFDMRIQQCPFWKNHKLEVIEKIVQSGIKPYKSKRKDYCFLFVEIYNSDIYNEHQLVRLINEWNILELFCADDFFNYLKKDLVNPEHEFIRLLLENVNDQGFIQFALKDYL